MTPLVACLPLVAFTQAPLEARVHFEGRQPDGAFVAVLAFATEGLETPKTHGSLHMLEHIMAKGGGGLDATLESRGCLLTARTERGALIFSVSGPEHESAAGVDALIELLTPRPVKDVTTEANVVLQELAMLPPGALAMDRAWAEVLPGTLRPHGDAQIIKGLTPKALTVLAERLLSTSRTSIVFLGSPNAKKAEERLAASLQKLPAGNFQPRTTEPVEGAGRGASKGTLAYGVAVGSFDWSETAAAVAAALAIDRLVADAQAVYTPSPLPGLAIVLAPAGTSLTAIDTARAHRLGSRLAAQYADTLSNDPALRAALIAKMRLIRPGFDLASAQGAYRAIGASEFSAALEDFKRAASQ